MASTDNPFFQIEVSRIHRDQAQPADWIAWEPHPMLWTAAAAIRADLKEHPERAGHYRIVRCLPLSDDALDKLTNATT